MTEYHTLLLSQALTQLRSSIRRRLNRLIHDIRKVQLLKSLQRGIRRAIRTSNVLPQLCGLIIRLNEHLSSTETSLRRQPRSLLLRQTESSRTSNKMLNHSEEIRRTGSYHTKH